MRSSMMSRLKIKEKFGVYKFNLVLIYTKDAIPGSCVSKRGFCRGSLSIQCIQSNFFTIAWRCLVAVLLCSFPTSRLFVI